MSESSPNERKHKLPECREGKPAARAFAATLRGLMTVPHEKLAMKLEKEKTKRGK